MIVRTDKSSSSHEINVIFAAYGDYYGDPQKVKTQITVGYPTPNDTSTIQPLYPNLRNIMEEAPRLFHGAEDQDPSS